MTTPLLVLAAYLVLVGAFYAAIVAAPPEDHPPAGPLALAVVMPILLVLGIVGLAVIYLATALLGRRP